MTKHAPGSFCWFECGSTDAAKAKKFYTELFGWNSMDVPMPGGMGQYTLMKIDEHDVAGLYEMSGEQFAGAPSQWATYVCVESTDASVERAKSLGATIVVPPMDVGAGRIATLQDPTGAAISLFQPGASPGAAQLGHRPGTFGWSELATRDTAGAVAFYTELFHWSTKTDENGPFAYTEFSVGGTPIGGMKELTEEDGDAPPHWMLYVGVESCDATVAQVTALGGEVVVPPTDVPDVGRFSVFSDPAGARLAVIQMNPEHGK